jgi:hypothetical protein
MNKNDIETSISRHRGSFSLASDILDYLGVEIENLCKCPKIPLADTIPFDRRLILSPIKHLEWHIFFSTSNCFFFDPYYPLDVVGGWHMLAFKMQLIDLGLNHLIRDPFEPSHT